MLSVAPVPGGLYFFQPISAHLLAGCCLHSSFLWASLRFPSPEFWGITSVCADVFPISSWEKQQKVTLMCPLSFHFLVVPVASFVGPLHLAFWIEVVFTSTFPSLSAFILETFTELVFQAGVCVFVSLCLCVSVLGGEGLCDSI